MPGPGKVADTKTPIGGQKEHRALVHFLCFTKTGVGCIPGTNRRQGVFVLVR